MNGFIRTLVADGPRPPSRPAAAHACGLRFPRSTDGALMPPRTSTPPPSPAAPAPPARSHPRFRGPRSPRVAPTPPGSSAAAASTDAFGYAHMSSTRSRLFGGGKMLAKCVPRCLAMARLCSDAFPKGSRTRKTPVRGKICAPCIQKALQIVAGGYTARRSCHEGSLFPSETLKSCIARRCCHYSAFAGPYA